MVVLAIIGVISVVAITNQGSFNKTLVLTNAAYDIALTIRSAESFGLGSRVASGSTNAGFGIHFTTGTSFVLFADTSPGIGASSGLCHPPSPTSVDPIGPDARPGDCVWQLGEEVPPSYTLNNGIFISNFCVFNSSGTSTCSPPTGTLTSVDITFSRPNPDVQIRASGLSTPYERACLVIASSVAPSGPFRYVSVYKSGAIAESATPCL